MTGIDSSRVRPVAISERLVWLLILAATTAFSTGLYYLGLSHFGGDSLSRHATSVTFILIFSVLLHEMGHWAVLEYHGVPSHVFLMVLLGGAGPHRNEDFDRMNRQQMAQVSIAGPLANVVLLLVGIVLWHQTHWTEFGVMLASINAGLIVFNLLPFWILDGKRILMAVLESTNEQTDRAMVTIGSLMIASCFIGAVAYGRLSFYPIFLVIGMLASNRHDDPAAADQPTSMRVDNAWMVFFAWIFIWVLCFLALLTAPNWTTAYQ